MYEKERYGKRVERIGKWRKREEPKRENKSWPRRQSEPREEARDDRGKGMKWKRDKREGEEYERVRERRDTRERLCRGYMEMLVKYIIPA